MIDPPTVGQNLLGQQEFTRAIGALGTGASALVVMTTGVQSHRGTDWRQSGVFDRLSVVQGETRWHPTADGFRMVKRLALADAPALRAGPG